tara:strand:- start:14066 stop:14260 length:195 start_codon:yes stop_codon:yes gene_type:complete
VSAPGWLQRINNPDTDLYSLLQITQYGEIALGLYLAGYRRQKPESSDNQRSAPKQDRTKVFDVE